MWGVDQKPQGLTQITLIIPPTCVLEWPTLIILMLIFYTNSHYSTTAIWLCGVRNVQCVCLPQCDHNQRCKNATYILNLWIYHSKVEIWTFIMKLRTTITTRTPKPWRQAVLKTLLRVSNLFLLGYKHEICMRWFLRSATRRLLAA